MVKLISDRNITKMIQKHTVYIKMIADHTDPDINDMWAHSSTWKQFMINQFQNKMVPKYNVPNKNYLRCIWSAEHMISDNRITEENDLRKHSSTTSIWSPVKTSQNKTRCGSPITPLRGKMSPDMFVSGQNALWLRHSRRTWSLISLMETILICEHTDPHQNDFC